MTQKTVIAFSGGMDSATLLYQLLHAGDEVFCVNFDYGSKHGAQERKYAAEFCRTLGVSYREIALPFINQLFRSNLLQSGGEIPKAGYDKATMAQTVVPGRNSIFMSILAGYAESIGASRIAIANHAGDHYLYPDCRPEWVAAMSLTIFHSSDHKVRLFAPFAHMDKSSICQLGESLNVPYENTWSCYVGGEQHCGSCGTCRERKQAFIAAGVEDPTSYL
jgi:7-cyano-7-deazaguanine synthase